MHSQCCLKVGVIGINHKTANLSFREEMARAGSSLLGEKALFFPHPVLLLSTCNRTEIYFGGSDLAAIHSEILRWLRGYIPGIFEHRLYSYFEIDCFLHLSRVIAGLDSAIFAETEIQAQVKEAYAKACTFSSLTSCMHYIFQKGLKVGKAVRSHMTGYKAPGLSQAIWQLAEEHFQCLINARFLLVGYSEVNRAVAHFLEKKKKRWTWITQEPSNICWPGCTPLGYEAIDRWIAYDCIVCASAQDRFLIVAQPAFRHAIFDLSVPRNVDPEVGRQEGIMLYNIEQINEWIQKTKSKHTGQLALAQEIVRKEVTWLARLYAERASKFNMSRISWKGNHISNVFHSCDEENQSLETETKSCMRDGAKFAKF